MASKQYFPTVGQIEFEGLESKNPMAFRYYDPEKVVKGRKMKDWFRFSILPKISGIFSAISAGIWMR